MSAAAPRSSTAAAGLLRSPANILPVTFARSCHHLFLVLIGCVLGAAAAQPAAITLAPLAHSSLLAVDAAASPGGLTLRVRRVGATTPLVVTDVAVTVDNHVTPAARRPDGDWFVPRNHGSEDAGKTIEVTVGHDGIHEVLSGRLGGSAGASSADSTSSVLSSSRKQLFWWILNIAIVAIAAIAISRRTS